MFSIRLNPDEEPVESIAGLVATLIKTTDSQVAEIAIADPEGAADFSLSTDALNFHRIQWRISEELGTAGQAFPGKFKEKLCSQRGYEPEEFDAALIATRDRPRLPYGWTAMDLAVRRLVSRPVRLSDVDLEASRYAKGVIG